MSDFKRFPNRPRGGPGGNPRGDRHRDQSPRRQEVAYLRKGSIVYVLDILQHGGVDRPDKTANRNWQPVCQVLLVPTYHFFELALNKGEIVSIQQKIEYVGEKSPLGRIQRRLAYGDLTMTSKDILPDVLQSYVKDNEAQFVEFLNQAGPITIKRHSLEVLPGIGKKTMWDLVNQRQRAPFQSFDDLKRRVPGLKIEEIIAKRIVEELSLPDEKHFLFVKRGKPKEQAPQRPPQNNPF